MVKVIFFVITILKCNRRYSQYMSYDITILSHSWTKRHMCNRHLYRLEWRDQAFEIDHSIFKHIIDLHEDSAKNMRCHSILFDPASQLCGGSLWVKIDFHVHATPVYCNCIWRHNCNSNGGSKCVKRDCTLLRQISKLIIIMIDWSADIPT